MVKTFLSEEFYNKLSSQIPNMSRLDLYSDLDVNINSEHSQYCSILTNRHYRSMISKLRTDTLPIEIELGRYRSTPREQRLCRNCSTNSVETTEHFIFNCNKYNVNRCQFYEKNSKDNINFHNLLDRQKLLFLLNSDSFYILNSFAKYIHDILLKRNSSNT